MRPHNRDGQYKRSYMTATSLQRLIAPLVTPAVFDFWAGKVNPVWSWERTLARVVDRRQESVDAVTLVLRPNRHFAGFWPGQHVNVSAEVNGRRVTRSYSFTGLPRADGCISITVKQISGGVLSTHLCRDTRVGDVLELGAAFGDMMLDATNPLVRDRKFLLLAAGSGITPLISMTRAMAAAGMPADLTLIYWARTRDELCYVRELRELAAAMPRFKVRFMLTRDIAMQADEGEGRISDAVLQALVPDLGQRQVSCCGPSGFVHAAIDLAGATARTFQAEAFTAPVFETGATGTVQVNLLASGRTLEVPVGQSLLSALEAQGLNPAHGCRIGICNTCACGKSAGTTQDMNTGEYSAEPVTALRLCISRASTDLTLDI